MYQENTYTKERALLQDQTNLQSCPSKLVNIISVDASNV